MPKRLPRSRTLKGDPKLAYYDSGGGAAGEPPIVLLHASTFRSEDWENVFPRLATRYRVIAYDARGHGKSGRAKGYGLTDFADDLVHVLRDVAAAPSILIGHSLGGAAAIVAAARTPELVRGLVLEDPPIARYGRKWTHELYVKLRAALDTSDDPARLRMAVSRLPLEAPGPRGERTVGEVRGFYSAERRAAYYAGLDPAFLDARLGAADDEGQRLLDDSIGKVRCPALLLVADHRIDSALEQADLDLLTRTIPGLGMVRFPGVDHRVHGLRPEPFLEALEPFLRKVRSA